MPSNGHTWHGNNLEVMNVISFTYPRGIEDHPKIIFILYFQAEFRGFI